MAKLQILQEASISHAMDVPVLTALTVPNCLNDAAKTQTGVRAVDKGLWESSSASESNGGLDRGHMLRLLVR